MLQPKKPKIPLKQKIKYAKGYAEGIIKYKLMPPPKETREAKKQRDLEKKALEEEFGIVKEVQKKKKGGATDNKWMQKASASIKRRGTEGKCTPITKPGCTGKARTLALTFKKIAKANKKK